MAGARDNGAFQTTGILAAGFPPRARPPALQSKPGHSTCILHDCSLASWPALPKQPCQAVKQGSAKITVQQSKVHARPTRARRGRCDSWQAGLWAETSFTSLHTH